MCSEMAGNSGRTPRVVPTGSTVYFEEFFRSRSVEREHLHGRDFETFFQNRVDNLSGKASCDNVRFDNSASAVCEVSRGSLTHEYFSFGFLLLG